MNWSNNIKSNFNADLIITIEYCCLVYKIFKSKEEDCRWLIKSCTNNSKTLNRHLLRKSRIKISLLMNLNPNWVKWITLYHKTLWNWNPSEHTDSKINTKENARNISNIIDSTVWNYLHRSTNKRILLSFYFWNISKHWC